MLPDKRMRQNDLNVLPLQDYQGKTTCESLVRLLGWDRTARRKHDRVLNRRRRVPQV